MSFGEKGPSSRAGAFVHELEYIALCTCLLYEIIEEKVAASGLTRQYHILISAQLVKCWALSDSWHQKFRGSRLTKVCSAPTKKNPKFSDGYSLCSG